MKDMDPSIVIENAIIENTFLGFRDAVFTFSLTLRYENTRQVCTEPIPEVKLIGEVLKIAEINCWENLRGRVLRSKHSYIKVYSIGHIINNQWLDFDKFFESLENKTENDE